MEKFKVGQEISDEEGWRQVTHINDDGYVYFADEDGGEIGKYYPQYDKSLGNNEFHGFVVKLSGRKDFRGYTEKFFDNKPLAKYWAETQVKKSNQPLYYRVEDAILVKCPVCGKIRRATETACNYCEKMRMI